MIRATLASSLLLAGLLNAQSATSIFVPDNNASTGGANVIPMGQGKTSTTWANQKYQTLIPASYAKQAAVRIHDLGFAPSSTNLHDFDSIVIKMDVVPLTQTTLNRTFASNLSNKVVTVLDARKYGWNLTTSQWTRIGLQKSFLWLPALGNLVIDIEVRGAGGVGTNTGGFRRSSTIERLYAVGWTGNPPATGNASVSLAALKVELVTDDADASPFGQACPGSSGTPKLSYTGLPQVGKTFSVDLSGALASTVALHLIGLTNSAPVFPLDLTPFGAPGCNLYISPDFAISTPTLQGSISQKVAVPNNSALVGVRYWDQFLVLDKQANKFGWSASNQGRVLIGK